MTTEDTRAQKRKIAVKFLAKIYDEDIACLASIHTAEAEGDWNFIYHALDATESFIYELKRAIK